jgi:hypothetical protein
MMTEREIYIAELSSWPRPYLLRTCRAAGLTAHKLKTNEELAALLWEATAPMRARRDKTA